MVTVTMPQLGESVTEGTIGSWLVQPGDRVRKYDALVEVITDKVTAEVPSPADGTVGELLAAEGQLLQVGEPICRLDGDGARGDGAGGDDGSLRVDAPPLAPVPLAPAGAPAAPPGPANPFISPVVRALAAENGIDLDSVVGTGAQGRITKRDVVLHLEGRGAATAASPGAAPSAPVPPAPPAAAPAPPARAPQLTPETAGTAPLADERIPLSPMRRTIAEHMVRSLQTAPHAWTMVEVDMSGVVAAREAQRSRFRATTGVDLSFLPFALKATALGLREVPAMNATFAGDAIVRHRDINLGIAVAVDDGLVVPVLRDADRFSCAGLAQLAHDLVSRARAGRLRLEDVEGGTFTLNNAGALGTVVSQAIINQPQAGILVMDSVVRRPVAIGDAIGIRPIMNLCLSFDHRVNDGAGAARFLRCVRDWLEAVTADHPLY